MDSSIMGLLVGAPLIIVLWVLAIGAGFFLVQLMRGEL